MALAASSAWDILTPWTLLRLQKPTQAGFRPLEVTGSACCLSSMTHPGLGSSQRPEPVCS